MSLYIEGLSPAVKMRTTVTPGQPTTVLYEVLVLGRVVWSQTASLTKSVKYRQLIAREQEAAARRFLAAHDELEAAGKLPIPAR